MIQNILMGVVGGCAYSLAGLANSGKRESFDWKKMIPTVVIAGIVGGVAGFTGQDYGIIMNSASAAGITVVVQKCWQGLMKKVK